MSCRYLTLEAPAEAVFREKMSKFIAFAIPVRTADEARSHIADIARRYHDARHVCWAYMLGADGAEYQSNDNGEPSGTAGRPILGQIRSAGLTYLVIAVVRYFGGIKLGTSGLIAAYREAARMAIEAGNIVSRSEMSEISFTFPYLAMNDVMKIIKDSGAGIVSQQFDNSCSMTILTEADYAPRLTASIAAVSGTSITQPQ
ncbi:MAG: YigZ family protein [Paramuribaculum sp.]|nr:YigZ family protein [Paramuribaculum sp.]